MPAGVMLLNTMQTCRPDGMTVSFDTKPHTRNDDPSWNRTVILSFLPILAYSRLQF